VDASLDAAPRHATPENQVHHSHSVARLLCIVTHTDVYTVECLLRPYDVGQRASVVPPIPEWFWELTDSRLPPPTFVGMKRPRTTTDDAGSSSSSSGAEESTSTAPASTNSSDSTSETGDNSSSGDEGYEYTCLPIPTVAAEVLHKPIADIRGHTSYLTFAHKSPEVAFAQVDDSTAAATASTSQDDGTLAMDTTTDDSSTTTS